MADKIINQCPNCGGEDSLRGKSHTPEHDESIMTCWKECEVCGWKSRPIVYWLDPRTDEWTEA